MSKNYIVEITPSFEKEYHKLKKSYPRIDDDFDEFLNDVEINGHLGDSVPGIVKDGNKVFKKRMRNTSAKKGLSGGFRIIKYLVTKDNIIYLLDIYSKSDKVNISDKRIRRLIKKEI